MCTTRAFRLREDGRFLKYAFASRHADAADREEIAQKRGVRWSALDILPDWMPGRDAVVEFMHAGYLGKLLPSFQLICLIAYAQGVVRHTLQDIVVGSGLLTKRARKDKPEDKFEEFIDGIWWPSGIGRVPSKVLSSRVVTCCHICTDSLAPY